MRKTLTTALAALTLAVGVIPATEAAARDRRHRDNDGAAIVAGIAGLAIGAALASGNRDRGYYYDDRRYGYYDRGYAPGYAYAPRGYYAQGYYAPPRQNYRRCRTWTSFDPYIGAYVRHRSC